MNVIYFMCLFFGVVLGFGFYFVEIKKNTNPDRAVVFMFFFIVLLLAIGVNGLFF